MKKEDIKSETKEMFSNKPDAENLKTVIAAIKNKKDSDKTSVCNIKAVVEIIEKLGNETTETALDTLITTAMILPTPLLMFAIDKLKALTTVKMLKDIQDMAVKKEKGGSEIFSEMAAAMALKELSREMKEDDDSIKSILN